jgi:CRP-like cAMP-binding protein
MSFATPAVLALVPASLRRVIEPRLHVMRAAKGRTLVGIGARSTDVFFVIEGEAQVVLYSSNGREVSVRALGPGDVFGELAALDGEPRSASVVALSDLRAVAMSGADFMTCIESSPSAAIWLARRLGAEVRRLTEKVFELSALNVQARLHCELLRMARLSSGHEGGLSVSPAPTHAELANRIGTHREAVTREMRLLAQRNIIRHRRRSLEFLDLAGLEVSVGRAIGEFA